MALPITVLPARVRKEYQPGTAFCTVYDYKELRKQAKPYNIVLPYWAVWGTSSQARYHGDYYGGSPPADVIADHGFDQTNIVPQLKTLSFERLKGRAYESASVGLNIVEVEQSVSMIAKTAGTLLKAARQIKKGNFVSAARTLRQKFVPKNVKRHKSFASNWLEYHFGWTPLLGDIHDAMEVLRQPVHAAQKSRGKATHVDGYRNIIDTPYSSGFYRENWTTSVLQCIYVNGVADEAAFSLEQLGLNNPLALAWEAVPYSFVVDWFANVGNILQNHTAFSGLELGNSFTSVKHIISGSFAIAPKYADDPYRENSGSWSGGVSIRISGASDGGFQFKNLKPPSKERALTAISLLLQHLR